MKGSVGYKLGSRHLPEDVQLGSGLPELLVQILEALQEVLEPVESAVVGAGRLPVEDEDGQQLVAVAAAPGSCLVQGGVVMEPQAVSEPQNVQGHCFFLRSSENQRN